MSNLANMVTKIVLRNSKFVGLMKAVLTFSIKFEKEYYEKFVPTRNVDILKDMKGSASLQE